MGAFKSLIDCFHTQKVSLSERVNHIEVSFECPGNNIPDSLLIENLLVEFPKRDTVNISLCNIVEESLKFSNLIIPEDIKETYERFKKEDFVQVDISIEKHIENNIFSIYDFNSFTDNLCSKSILEIMDIFNNLLFNREYLNIELQESNEILITNTIAIKGISDEAEPPFQNRRKDIHSRCKLASAFFNKSGYTIIPDDFHVLYNSTNCFLVNLFEKIETVLSISYITNSATLNDSILKIQICGYRNYSFDLNLNDIKTNKEFYKIFSWIYIDGNPVDKSIIARNVLSLHCRYINIIDIDNTVFSSIQSNFSLYQKDNVNQYLELKNKLANNIIELSSKSGNLVVSLIDKLKKNIIAFLSFFATVFLTNIISNSSLNNIFTKDITFLTYAFLIVSFLYLLTSNFELNFQLKKIEEGYNELKKHYVDVLDINDINEIFKSNSEFYNSVKDVKTYRLRIMITWILILVITFFVTDYLSAVSLLNQIPPSPLPSP